VAVPEGAGAGKVIFAMLQLRLGKESDGLTKDRCPVVSRATRFHCHGRNAYSKDTGMRLLL
jgi:hypothetical protein